MKNFVVSLFNCFFAILLPFFINFFALYFFIVSLDFLPFDFVRDNRELVCFSLLVLFLILNLSYLLFYRIRFRLVYKFIFLASILLLLVVVAYCLLVSTKFLEKFKSIEDFRAYVSSFGSASVIIFIILQILQVVILPIPSLITTGSGILLFGVFKGALFSVVGIVFGSIFAFFIGRIFGYKAVKWLVGEEALNKALKSIAGADKVLIAFMLLFPFFPDDLLCFVSGITTVSPLFFIFTVLVTRTIAVFFSSLSISNNLIPFNTWWGILLWVIFFIFTALLTFYLSSHGRKIEEKLLKHKTK